jgi:hypothetical protein
MTLESDKLPAAAGIAIRIHEVTGSDYIAGLAKEGADNESLLRKAFGVLSKLKVDIGRC